MIEDDLRTIIAGQLPTVAVYSRFIPPELPECIAVQEVGGRSSTAGIRRNIRIIAVMACSKDKQYAEVIVRLARDALIRHIPADVNGTHYYTARALADGHVLMKARNGPRYIETCDLEVVASI